MNILPSSVSQSCQVEEVFDLPGATSMAGASLLVDFMRRQLGLRHLFTQLPNQKSETATYALADELEIHVLSRQLGFKRISHMEVIENDPLICSKIGLEKLPQISTLYRTLERFETAEDLRALGDVSDGILPLLIDESKSSILDLDTTVETVYGAQEGSSVGYNPRAHGRPSFQPLIAFEANSKAGVHAELRSGRTPSGEDVVQFFQTAKARLPGEKPSFVRADRGFSSERFYAELEQDEVGYTIKMKTSPRLLKQAQSVVWRPLACDPTVEIQVGAVLYQAHGWSRARRVALIRTREAGTPQASLFPEYTWTYEAIVTNLEWDPEDIWHFYNQRCTCENYIKELKDGVHLDAISKYDFFPNAADMWLKMIAYNGLLAFKALAPEEQRDWSIERFRRAILCIPGVLVRHARQLKLRMAAYWKHQDLWYYLRAALNGS